MNENGKEFVAKKKWDKSQTAIFFAVIAVMVVMFVLLRTIWWMVAFLFVLGVLSLYYMNNTFKAEYAYTVSSKLKIEVLKSGGKRRDICEFFMSDMVFCGKYADENGKHFDNLDNVVRACTDERDDETYCAVFEREEKREAVLFTPNEMMLNEMKKYTDRVE